MIPDHPQRDYRGLHALVMGLGSFGGGLGAVKFLIARGARITITDSRPAEKLTESLAELSDLGEIELKLGGHDESDFRCADLVVVNPAVKRDHPCLNAAISSGVPLTSEMNLFWQWNPAPIVAVTGSNGKSTTTALTHSILCQSGRRAWLGGNIGGSLLAQVDQIHSDDLVVLELSSFQLTDLDRLQVSPHVSIITNFSPNHLDWHATLDHYRSAKQTMLRWQRSIDAAVLNEDDLDVSRWSTRGDRLGFGLHPSSHLTRGVFIEDCHARVAIGERQQELPLSNWLKLPGDHNLANAAAATCAAMWLGSSVDDVCQGLAKYKPLPHRLQFVGEVQGRSFYNDSLATTPESTKVALKAFTSPVILLAGGYDKQVDLSQMAAAIASQTKAVALMGQTASRLSDLISSHSDRKCLISGKLASFRDAFDWALEQSTPGDVILLSPGCASYDWFRNFADRGHQFIEFVRALAAELP